jgi:hypothetical protein
VSKNLVPHYKGIKDAVTKIYREEGLKGFTKGIIVSLTVNVSSRTLFFTLYKIFLTIVFLVMRRGKMHY